MVRVASCPQCGNEVVQSGKGRPKVYCGKVCQRAANGRNALHAQKCLFCKRRVRTSGDFCGKVCRYAHEFTGVIRDAREGQPGQTEAEARAEAIRLAKGLAEADDVIEDFRPPKGERTSPHPYAAKPGRTLEDGLGTRTAALMRDSDYDGNQGADFTLVL